MKPWAVALASAPLLGGCPPPDNGILRTATVESIDNRCVEAALRATNDVLVMETTGDEAREKTGNHDYFEATRRFSYAVSGHPGYGFVIRRETKAGPVTVYSGWGGQNATPLTPDEARIVLQTLVPTEAAIGKACGVTFVFKTRCSNVQCPDPAWIAQVDAS